MWRRALLAARRVCTAPVQGSSTGLCLFNHARLYPAGHARSEVQAVASCSSRSLGVVSGGAASAAAFSTGSSMTQQSAAEQLLGSFINYETRGVPAMAGTSASQHFDLARMHRLLRELGDPHKRYPVVHVAGTKGKGSVVALTSAILRAAGYSVGSYSSPHMHHITERISTHPGGRPLPRQQFEALVQAHAPLLHDALTWQPAPASHFEVTTALALRHFADEAVDIAVIEAGLGGVTDATNVFDPAQLATAVITAIGMDHVAALGGDLRSIATAKAGILKAGRPVILGTQHDPDAAAVVTARARTLDSPLVRADERVSVRSCDFHLLDSSAEAPLEQLALEVVDVQVQPATAPATSATSSSAISGDGGVWQLRSRLVGPHQHDNIRTAVAAVLQLRQQGFDDITDASIAAGIESAFKPGCFQLLQMPAATAGLGSSTQAATDRSLAPYLLLDGAHTRESARALVSSPTRL